MLVSLERVGHCTVLVSLERVGHCTVLVSLGTCGVTGLCWSRWNVLVSLERVGHWTVLDHLDWITPLENNVRSFHRELKTL